MSIDAKRSVPCLISAEQIQARVEELGQAISRDYQDRSFVIVPILRGSFVFAADLMRQIEGDVAVDFMGLRSYGDEDTSSGVVRITHDLTESIKDRHVIIVEDIVDTGLTLSYLIENLQTRQPASIKLATLLNKPSRTKVEVQIDYLGFEIEDVFVVGYGLDYADHYRNLPYIGVVET